ncbi:hypothetical protein RvY_18677 [Ramazzottius varieornatus]|uniref:RRM domain-containing protein n=1 Tax=Ramazzottius varieornatus TaxID=947166 RepID=A0A1D1WBL1_RAMVA|nr:hypothetical protein RvY_18677 [Ramazzottius varieornatus]
MDAMHRDVQTAEDHFDHFLSSIQKVCLFAVFHHNKDVMQDIYDKLIKKQEDLAAVLRPLSVHLGKTPPKEPEVQQKPQSPEVKEAELPGQRVAANFPGLKPNGSATSLAGIPAQNGTTSPRVPTQHCEKLPFVRSSAPLPTNWRTVTHGLPKSTSVPTVAPIESENRFAVLETESEPRSGTPDFEKEFSADGKDRDQNKIFLMSLARQSDSKSVAAYFGKFGAVVDVKIFRFPNGDSRGVGTVEFTDPEVVKNLLVKNEKHSIDGRPVALRPFLNRQVHEYSKGRYGERFQVFLGGIPTFLSKDEVREILSDYVEVRDIRLNSERGYAYLDLEHDEDVRWILREGRMRMGEKMVEVKENLRRR